MKELSLIIALVILVIMKDVSWNNSSHSQFIHIFNSPPLTLIPCIHCTSISLVNKIQMQKHILSLERKNIITYYY
jgi:hypothetical protein